MMKTVEEGREENGRIVIFKFEFFDFSFFSLVPLQILFFGFGLSPCVTIVQFVT